MRLSVCNGIGWFTVPSIVCTLKVIEPLSIIVLFYWNYLVIEVGRVLFRGTVSALVLALLVVSIFTLSFNVQPVTTEPTVIVVPDNYPTIQGAINAANIDDTIYVRNGAYYEHVIINKTLSLIGEDRSNTIIDGNKTGTVVKVTADNVAISGFTVQSGEIGLDLCSNNNTITSNTISSNGAQETDLKTNLEIYPEPPSVPIWRFIYELMSSSYTEFLDLTTDTPILKVNVTGHSTVAELAVGLFYDENMDGIAQLSEYTGFASRAQVTWVILPNPAKGRYIIKVQGWDVLGNPGHFDREITRFNGYGIGAHQTSNNIISQNLVMDNHAGVYLQSCSNTAVHTNNMTRNLGAIIVGDTVNSTIYDNKAFDNRLTICLRNSTNISLTKNVLSSNSIGIHIWNSSAINIAENELHSHAGCSIGLISSVDSNVANNSISTVTVLDGIRLMISSRNNLIGNNVSQCEHSGILLWYDCYNNSITNNCISLSGSQGGGHAHGIEVLLSHNNVFSKNVLWNNRNQGVVAIETTNNNFTENTFISNRIGIQLLSSSGNRVCHNGIINNWEQQGFDDTGENFWDDDYPSGGNYWSDYNGADVKKGPDQNELGRDSIGDAPYTIDGNNMDRYPLISPYVGPDVAVVNATLSRTVIGQGESIIINATVQNQFGSAEAFNVTAYADATIIQTENIALTGRNSTNVTFTWDTSDFSKGNYTLSVVADTVPSETETEDNRYVAGWGFVLSLEHDVAIMGIASKTVVGQGYNSTIEVDSMNVGSYVEAFDVTVYVNTTLILSQTVALESGAFTTLAFAWDAAGFADGNYTVWAYAWLVDGETDIEDNTFVGGTVAVVLAGDLNIDGIVDFRDINEVARLFGKTPTDPQWDPNCDIVEDNFIDFRDIGVCCRDFGKTYDL